VMREGGQRTCFEPSRMREGEGDAETVAGVLCLHGQDLQEGKYYSADRQISHGVVAAASTSASSNEPLLGQRSFFFFFLPTRVRRSRNYAVHAGQVEKLELLPIHIILLVSLSPRCSVMSSSLVGFTPSPIQHEPQQTW
jgi:hypothetical protein